MSGWVEVAKVHAGTPVLALKEVWDEAWKATYERGAVAYEAITGIAEAAWSLPWPYLLTEANAAYHVLWQVYLEDWIFGGAEYGDFWPWIDEAGATLVETGGGQSLFNRYRIGEEGDSGDFHLLDALQEAGFGVSTLFDMTRPRLMTEMPPYFDQFYQLINSLLKTAQVKSGLGDVTKPSDEEGYSDEAFAEGEEEDWWERNRLSAWVDIPSGATGWSPIPDVGRVGYASWEEEDHIHAGYCDYVQRDGTLAYLKAIADADSATIVPKRILVGFIYERAVPDGVDDTQFTGMPWKLEMSGDGGANWTTLATGTTETDAGYHAATGETSTGVANLLTDDALIRLSYDGDKNADSPTWAEVGEGEERKWYSEGITVDRINLFVEFDWTFKAP